MQSIDPNTVYELTPEGHDVMQHRSLQLPTELRFLMMLISGTRSVGTLRVVSPAAKYDDAGFIILMEYGLIKNSVDEPQVHASEILLDRSLSEQSENQTLFMQKNTFEYVSHEATWPSAAVDENRLTAGQAHDAFTDAPLVSSPQSAYEETFIADADMLSTPEPEAANPSGLEAQDQTNAIEALAFTGEPIAMQAEISDHTHNPELTAPVTEPELINDLQHQVSNEDRRAVELILQRALKQDAKFVIDQLAQKNTYADFLPAVKKLEHALRETVSTIEANALLDRFSAAFK